MFKALKDKSKTDFRYLEWSSN